ncbi:MAG: asparagine--tRNA ligase [Planctomycetota bacterium]
MPPAPAPVVRIEDLPAHAGRRVRLQGWLYNRSGKGKIQFVHLRDGTGIVQCVVSAKEVPPALFAALTGLGQESSLELEGMVARDDRAPGGCELSVRDGQVVQAAAGYPITPKEHGADFLLGQRHLWLRSRRQWAILRIRHTVIAGLRGFLDGRGFVCVDSPMFTPNPCEGTTTLFAVDYFDRTAFLTQSGQLYAEAAAMALGKVYCFGPTFRAEKSKTRRHLTEFWMLEPEMAYADLDDVMELAEDMIVHVVQKVLAERRLELGVLERDVAKLAAIQKPFPRLTYEEAAAILAAHPDSRFTPGDDLGAPDETILSLQHDRPVMITRYPAAVKAFYMKRDPARPDLALCVDVLAPEGIGEIIGGSQREDDPDLLLARLREHGLSEEAFRWYLDLRRFGTVPHGGFGIGLERTVGWICGVEHIRECIPFPRTIYRMEP